MNQKTKATAAPATTKTTVRRPVKGAPEPKPCTVRFDTDKNQWVRIEPETRKVLEAFDVGIMTDVTFSTDIVRQGYGCAATDTSVGLATGMLTVGSHGTAKVGFRNLGYSQRQGAFLDVNGNKITKASAVRLMTGRAAVYLP